MPTLKLKRATVAQNDSYIGDPGEIVVLTDDNYRAVVHDGTTSGGHPLALESELGSGGTTVPDSADLQAQYDAQALKLSDGDSVQTWGDESGNGNDLTAGTAPSYVASGINGNPSVRFNGVGEFLDVAWTAYSQPHHIYIVYQLQSVDDSANEYLFDGETDTTRHSYAANSNGFWSIYADNTQEEDGSTDLNAHIAGLLYDGGGSKIRLDGIDESSGTNIGADDSSGLTVGSQQSQIGFAEVDVGEILVYPKDKTAVEADIDQYLSDKWGVSV